MQDQSTATASIGHNQSHGTLRTGLFPGLDRIWLATTAVQWLLHQLALLTPMMETSSLILGSGLLIAAGLFQFSPLKNRCLQHCRVPFSFSSTNGVPAQPARCKWAPKHGSFCLGCCWILMLLLFVAGVMNLLWVAALAILVLLEKVLPAGLVVSRIAGIIFIVWGIWLIASPMFG
ncbi:MAG: DUF2182 domain-containing protein [Caldilineaceae bacterium]